MLKINDALDEKANILKKASVACNDITRMEHRDIIRYINICEYETLVKNCRFFLDMCPSSPDISRYLEYWRYLKGYLYGLRYVDEAMRNILETYEAGLQSMQPDGINFWRHETQKMLSNHFIPTWLAKWENKE